MNRTVERSTYWAEKINWWFVEKKGSTWSVGGIVKKKGECWWSPCSSGVIRYRKFDDKLCQAVELNVWCFDKEREEEDQICEEVIELGFRVPQRKEDSRWEEGVVFELFGQVLSRGSARIDDDGLSKCVVSFGWWRVWIERLEILKIRSVFQESWGLSLEVEGLHINTCHNLCSRPGTEVSWLKDSLSSSFHYLTF
jgi:hypothetical protein